MKDEDLEPTDDPAAGARRTPVPAAPRTATAARLSVLVVDDEPLVSRAVVRLLAAEHAVCVAETAEDALATIEGGDRYDAVVCDLALPGMSGCDLHARIAARDPALARRFVFLTGGAFTDASTRYLASCDVPCVEKPFQADRLREAIRAAAGRKG
ncbi:MAG: response regulator [Anaeromyxobacteraceae bacterium]